MITLTHGMQKRWANSILLQDLVNSTLRHTAINQSIYFPNFLGLPMFGFGELDKFLSPGQFRIEFVGWEGHTWTWTYFGLSADVVS